MHKKIIPLAIMTILLLLITGCAVPSAVPAPDYWPTEGWRASTPEEQGMDSDVLAQMFQHIERERINVRSLLIVRNGYLVTEAYFHPYTPDRNHTIESVTKAVTDMLVGIAIDRKALTGVDQSLLSFYPGRWVVNRDANKEAITLKHLLSLTAGFECNDAPGSGQRTMMQSDNWVAFMLDQPMAEAPGTRFNYCSGAAHLLSAILQQATGMSAREYANAHIFKPLGIAEVPPARWGTDPQHISMGHAGLYLTPRDMAKLGFLYLHGGHWEDQQIISADWVADSTRSHATKAGDIGYGYLWTVYPTEGRYVALGFGGQQVHVVPGQNLVVVFTAALPMNEVGEVPALEDLLHTYILPAAQSNEPLPANPYAAARLASYIETAARPVQVVSEMPDIARDISGKTFAFGSNPLDFQTLVITTPSGQAALEVSMNDSPPMPIGLDHRYRVIEGPDGAMATALRGWWEGEDTLIVEELMLGALAEYEFHLTFTGDSVNIAVQDLFFGGDPIVVHGTLQP